MKCRECGKEISDKAYECPNCGYQMKYPTPEYNDMEYSYDIDGDYYEVAFIYNNGTYDIILKTDINEENTSIFDLDYFFKINNNEKKNFYFKAYDYYDVDYLCGAIFSENENDYTKSISCQFSRSD